MLVASEDATSGSVMAKHDRMRPCSSGTSHRRCCSSVPYFAKTWVCCKTFYGSTSVRLDGLQQRRSPGYMAQAAGIAGRYGIRLLHQALRRGSRYEPATKV